MNHFQSIDERAAKSLANLDAIIEKKVEPQWDWPALKTAIINARAAGRSVEDFHRDTEKFHGRTVSDLSALWNSKEFKDLSPLPASVEHYPIPVFVESGKPVSGIPEDTTSKREPYNLLSGEDLCNAPLMRWLVRGVLPAEGLAALYGASGSGKGFLIFDMGCCIADGKEWFSRRVSKAPVTYVCLEGEAGMGKRIKAWKQHNGRPVPDGMKFILQPFQLMFSDDLDELAKAILAGNGSGGLVIIDTLNRAAPGSDENSSVDMGKLISAAKSLQIMVGGIVLLVHHTGKDTTKGLRGHSSLYAALDGAIEVIATDSRREWNVAKSKDDVTGGAYPFKLEIVPVGFDDEGDEITSCVIVPAEAGDVSMVKRPTLGKNQKIAQKALGEPLRKSPHIGKEGAPPGRPCIDYSEAVTIIAQHMPTDAKHQKESAKRAIGSLVANGYLGMKGDWLWDI
jgi:putative DNA primase/helicase